MKNFTILLFFLFVHNCIGQTSYLHCGKLLDVKQKKVLEEQTVIVKDGIIESVQRGYADVPADATAIDLKNKTVLPGLMDMHVHIEKESSRRSYEEQFRLNEADFALRATIYCKRTLDAGFTTVRDLGGSGINVSLRNAINKGYVVGPRIYTAEKSLATTGGHADPSNGYRRDIQGDPGPKEGVINSVEDAKKAVRQRYKNGADCIKVTATGGVLSVAKDGQGPQLTVEELKGIVDAAKDYGMTTAAHAHGDEGMRRAVEAGITTIEHGTLMSEATMDLMIQKGTYYVPTISAGKFVAEKAKVPGYYPAIIVPKAKEIGPKIQKTFEKAYKRGVKIAFGTDAGVFPHGDNAKEFIYMTEVGMSNIDAIESATIVAAQVLGIDDELGSIDAGKKADIIAVGENPLDKIESLLDIHFVMKGGAVFKDKE